MMKTILPPTRRSRPALAGLAAAALATTAFPAVPSVDPTSICVAATVPAAPADVWRLWTTSSGLQEFFAPQANVALHLGGPFEIFFDPTDPAKSSRGKLLSYTPGQMISFGWQLPPMFAELRTASTWVVVTLQPAGEGQCRVAIQQLGLGAGPVWDQVKPHMERGWTDVLGRLQARFTHGPIDWPAEMAAGPEKREFTLKARTLARP